MNIYTLVPRARTWDKHPDISDSRYFTAHCKIALFNKHWETSKQVKSSQNANLVVKVKTMHIIKSADIDCLQTESGCGSFIINLKYADEKIGTLANNYLLSSPFSRKS